MQKLNSCSKCSLVELSDEASELLRARLIDLLILCL